MRSAAKQILTGYAPALRLRAGVVQAFQRDGRAEKLDALVSQASHEEEVAT
jgi:hypothetical protein